MGTQMGSNPNAWVFNAYAGGVASNIEWDIPNGQGIPLGGTLDFGFTVPSGWGALEAYGNWIHSWTGSVQARSQVDLVYGRLLVPSPPPQAVIVSITPNPTKVNPMLTAQATALSAGVAQAGTQSAISSMVFAVDSQSGPFSPMMPSAGTITPTSEQATAVIDISALAEGTHTVFVQATDTAGGTSALAEGTFVVDRTPPVTTISDITPKIFYNGQWVTGAGLSPINTVTVTADSVDALTNVVRVEYALDDALLSSSFTVVPSVLSTKVTTQAVFGLQGLPQGVHTVYVRGTDAAGNVENPPASFSFFVDTTPPVIQINSPSNNAPFTVADMIYIDFTVSDPESGIAPGFTSVVLDWQTSIYGTPVANGVSIPAYQLGVGTHTLMVETANGVRLESALIYSFTITVNAPSFATLINQFSLQGLIQSGIADSLTSMLSAVQASLQQSNFTAAVNQLQAMWNAILAQAGKGISNAIVSFLQQILAALLQQNQPSVTIEDFKVVPAFGATVRVGITPQNVADTEKILFSIEGPASGDGAAGLVTPAEMTVGDLRTVYGGGITVKGITTCTVARNLTLKAVVQHAKAQNGQQNQNPPQDKKAFTVFEVQLVGYTDGNMNENRCPDGALGFAGKGRPDPKKNSFYVNFKSKLADLYKFYVDTFALGKDKAGTYPKLDQRGNIVGRELLRFNGIYIQGKVIPEMDESDFDQSGIRTQGFHIVQVITSRAYKIAQNGQASLMDLRQDSRDDADDIPEDQIANKDFQGDNHLYIHMYDTPGIFLERAGLGNGDKFYKRDMFKNYVTYKEQRCSTDYYWNSIRGIQLVGGNFVDNPGDDIVWGGTDPNKAKINLTPDGSKSSFDPISIDSISIVGQDNLTVQADSNNQTTVAVIIKGKNLPDPTQKGNYYRFSLDGATDNPTENSDGSGTRLLSQPILPVGDYTFGPGQLTVKFGIPPLNKNGQRDPNNYIPEIKSFSVVVTYNELGTVSQQQIMVQYK